MGGRYNYRLELAYDGTAFAGYARQPGLSTVESTLCAALTPLLDGEPTLTAGGRTDRGVSALGQVVSFRAQRPASLAALADAVDAAGRGALFCLDARAVSPSFHAHWSARARRYRYVQPGARPGRDVERLDRLLLALIGRRSFTAFARDTPRGQGAVRTLLEARAEGRRDAVVFHFAADGFLRRQVRVLVATALHLLEDPAADDDALLRLAEAGDRTRTQPPAAPEGLCLVRVSYDGGLSA